MRNAAQPSPAKNDLEAMSTKFQSSAAKAYPSSAMPAEIDARSRKGSSAQHRVAIFGLFGAGNHGNEGSLEVMLDMLRDERPDAGLVCICAGPDRVAADHGIATAQMVPSRSLSGVSRTLHRLFFRIPGKMFDLARAYRTLRRCDLMIVPGTGILDDFCERPAGMPLCIFIWCLAARAAGTRICMVSIGAGPIRHPLSRRLMVGAAKLADFRSYRDQVSWNFMRSVGVDTERDPIAPDLVFKMRTPEVMAPVAPPNGRICIGVGVMGYYGWYGFDDDGAAVFDTYIEKMVRLVDHILQSGYDVRLLVGDKGDDRIAVDTILARVQDTPDRKANIVAEPISSLHVLMEQIVRTDLVIATRFHNVVCSLKLGKPTISLGYAGKNDVLMAEMGLGEFCEHVESFEVEGLIGKMTKLMARRREVAAGIEAKTAAFRDSLEHQERYLLSEYLPARACLVASCSAPSGRDDAAELADEGRHCVDRPITK